MFTGIIESVGIIEDVRQEDGNIILTICSSISFELKVDQSLAHNGICLTVTGVSESSHRVTAIGETIRKTTIGDWKKGMLVNLERAMSASGRFDGHIVQGHVDQVAVCVGCKDDNGSRIYTFQYDASKNNVTVEKGSICVNGISLTVIDSDKGQFSVAIIPYTLENTSMKECVTGSKANIEFDIVGKYIEALLNKKNI